MGRNLLNILSLILAFVAVIVLMVYGMRRLAAFFIEPKFAQNQCYVEHVAHELNIGLCKHEHRAPMGAGAHAIFIVSLKALLLCM